MQLTTDKMIAETRDGVGWMIFNNPERRNALTFDMREAILEILTAFSADDNVRVVVMKGAGDKAFVSGADISQFDTHRATPEQRASYGDLVQKIDNALSTMGKPLIAMIHGYCLGGGLAMALEADIRVASDDAQFGIPAARLAIGYPYPGVKKLVDVVGPSCAKEILFSARRYSAAEALQMKLVNRVVPRNQLEDAVSTLAASMVENAPLTIRAAKIVIDNLLKDPGARDMAACDRAVEACMQSADFTEGRRAFLEKRKPVFTGH